MTTLGFALDTPMVLLCIWLFATAKRCFSAHFEIDLHLDSAIWSDAAALRRARNAIR